MGQSLGRSARGNRGGGVTEAWRLSRKYLGTKRDKVKFKAAADRSLEMGTKLKTDLTVELRLEGASVTVD